MSTRVANLVDRLPDGVANEVVGLQLRLLTVLVAINRCPVHKKYELDVLSFCIPYANIAAIVSTTNISFRI